MTDDVRARLLKAARSRLKHEPTFLVDAGPGRVACRTCGAHLTADDLFDTACAGTPAPQGDAA